jgi:membrane associated rhomboid family serine protease
MTVIIIFINVFVYIQSGIDGFGQHVYNTFTYGLIPNELFHGVALSSVPKEMLPESMSAIHPGNFPALLTIFTSMFMHGGLFHLLGNMWFLWLFGDNVEDRMGAFKFLLFYLIVGVVAALSHALVDTNSMVPMIGASGAIAGVTGAYLMMYPNSRIHTLVVLIVFFTTVEIPAIIYLGFWFIWQFYAGFTSLGAEGAQIAFFAHVGGFIAGLVLVKLFVGKNYYKFKRINQYESYY